MGSPPCGLLLTTTCNQQVLFRSSLMSARSVAYLCVALTVTFTQAQAENHVQTEAQSQSPVERTVEAPLPLRQAQAQIRNRTPNQARREQASAPGGGDNRGRQGAIVSVIALGDIGYGNGFRLANLGGRRDLFLPLPQGVDIGASVLALTVDDVSAHDAKRSLEILLNDRSVAAIALDGKGTGRSVRIPLGGAKPKDGFLKFSFLYSGAVTPDRCIDVRYVGDSLTVGPETAIELEIAFTGLPDVATAAALLPRDVTIVIPRRRLEPSDLAAALTAARSLASTGHRVAFHQGLESLPELARRESERWTRGLVVVASMQEVLGYLDAPVAT